MLKAGLIPGQASAPCPCRHSKLPGWAEVGLTQGQVERMQKVAQDVFDWLSNPDAADVRPELLRKLTAAFGCTPSPRGR